MRRSRSRSRRASASTGRWCSARWPAISHASEHRWSPRAASRGQGLIATRGHLLTFWEYAEELDGPLDARRAGRGLHECHEALADFERDLPPMALPREAEDLVERLSLGAEDAAMLRRVGADVRRRIDALALPVQAVHGDAHLGNVINTARGPLWNDWEDTFLGPVAWDLGCLHASAKAFGSRPAPVEAAQAGYGSPLADEVLDAFVCARRFQGTVWTMVFALRHPEAREWGAARLAWYRAPG